VLKLLLLLCISLTVHSEELFFYSLNYTVEKDENLEEVIKKFVKDNSNITSDSPMIHKTRGNNSHIENWGELGKDSKFKLYISNDFIDFDKYEQYKNRHSSKLLKTSSIQSTLYYMASAGDFTQKSNSNGINFKFSQNSPYTLGYVFNKDISNSPYSLSSSLYISKLSTGVSNLNQGVDVPTEKGLNLYFKHFLKKYRFSYFAGIDYEIFNSFNAGALEANSTIVVDENKILFLSVGLEKSIQILNKNLSTSFSISSSILSSNKIGAGGYSSKEYKGLRLLTYLKLHLNQSWFIHSMLKYHRLSGPDKLSILRYGIGIGYTFN